MNRLNNFYGNSVNNKKIRYIAVFCTFAFLFSAFCVGVSYIYAANTDSVDIVYTSGKSPDGNKTNAFDNVTVEKVEKTAAQTLILPGTKFSENISTVNFTGSARLDSETFYFDTPSEGQNYSDLWAYTFTGWKIKDAEEKIPGQTVFQPGDVITDDILEKYAPLGELELEALWGKCYFIRNPYENMVYTQTKDETNAKGEKIKIFELSTTESSNPTTANDANVGNDPALPKATVDGLYADLRAALGSTASEQNNNAAAYDAYATVVMLVGELDYYTDNYLRLQKIYGYETYSSTPVYVSATYKSLGDTQYNYNYKPRGYCNVIYGNFRFDNVNHRLMPTNLFSQVRGNEFQLYHSAAHLNHDTYLEFTARYNETLSGTSAISTLRPADSTYVVVNGGIFTGMQNQYQTSVLTGKQLYWTLGRNVRITTLTCGTTSTYINNCVTVYYNYDVKVLGGRIVTLVGGNNGMNTIAAGTRDIKLYGDGSGNGQYDPKIDTLFGGANEGRLFGDVYVTASHCTNLSHVYGGGNKYSATTYGDVNVTLENCIVANDVHGGGQNANCEVTSDTYIQYKGASDGSVTGTETSLESLLNGALADRIGEGGDVHINIIDTHVKGNVFGSGMGQSQTQDVRTPFSISYDWKYDLVYPKDDDWNLPVTGYPSYDPVDGRVFVYGKREGAYSSVSPESNSYYIWRTYALLSLATVESVYMNIDSSTIGTTSGRGNIYGGGSIAKVLGDVDIKINDSTVYGNVYGGGDGVTVPDQVQVYTPDTTEPGSAEFYEKPYYTVSINSTGNYEATWYPQKPAKENKTYTLYTWSNDESLLTSDTPGIDHENKLLYSPNTQGLGSVAGNCTVTITGGTLYKNVFGGGNEGMVDGNTTVSITNATVKGIAFGGGNGNETLDRTGILGAVKGNSSLTISGGDVATAYGGSNSADVGGSASLIIKDASNVTTAYGGNNVKGAIKGDITVVAENSTINSVFGGGNKAPYSGRPDITINSGTIDNAYGGGNLATVDSTELKINGGTIGNAYGGCNMADIAGNSSVRVNNATVTYVYGGNNESGVIQGNIEVEMNSGEVKFLIGGGNLADYTGAGVTVDVNGGLTHLVIGGGNDALVGKTTVNINDGCEIMTVCAGGYKGKTDETVLNLNGGVIKEAAMGGGYNGYTVESTVNYYATNVAGGLLGGGYRGKTDDATVNITTGNVTTDIFGGGYEGETLNAKVDFKNATALAVYGGGYKGKTHTTNVNVASGTVQNIYGGGYQGETIDSYVHLEGATVNENIYGGGNLAATESTVVDIHCGIVKGSVYGGGYAGVVGDTTVEIDDSKHQDELLIEGNVFGGGEGQTATVTNSTNVVIDLIHDFYATETPVSTSEITSGEIHTEISSDEASYSSILGSVYGGGDLGQVGTGTIDLNSNVANVTKSGTTNVTIKNGHIDGSVYGGGSGVPPVHMGYSVYMGTVFGQTNVNVWGGHVVGDIFGGGTQSRVFTSHSSLKAATVNIDQNHTAEGGNGKIAIEGSVFAGGERGNSATTNASVPTTNGDVEVNIIGSPDGQSTIYFLNGGIYGGGNLCLVNGQKVINITDFHTGDKTNLKTFHSLQRADKVVMSNSSVVLLGAEDLVEESDSTGYSINRVGSLELRNGSIIKLDSVVKYLGHLMSDVETKRQFIDKGNNGTNNYTTDGGAHPQAMLTASEIDAYRADTTLEKNVVCVANGLYLDVIKTDDTYGTVEGLFTLQLLYAKPGEGGGFVYGNKLTSTGDFICETKTGYKYTAQTSLTEFVSGEQYYVRVPGEGYVLSTDTTPQENTIYYTAELSDAYMDVVDNIGGLRGNEYTYYYWYINGPLISYKTYVTGYIGAEETQFFDGKTVPKHPEKLHYTLYSIFGDEVFEKALDESVYTLVQTKDNLVEQQIAVEVVLSGKSMGFLTYDNGVWGLKRAYDGTVITGYSGDVTASVENRIYDTSLSIVDDDSIVFKLHKSRDVNTELTNMNFTLEVDLFGEENEIYAGGTNTLVFNTVLSIVRLVPEQYLYLDARRGYTGVSTSTDISITGKSAFTAEYQTKYLPSAFPKDSGTMKWELSTCGYRYFLDKLGNYMTIDDAGNVINIAPNLKFTGNESAYNSVYMDETGAYLYKTLNDENEVETIELIEMLQNSASKIPANTKITMVDLSGDTPKYYYYICYVDETEISLEDFKQMGTTKKISELSEKPDFIKGYDEQKTARFTERLVFIFDHNNVDWENELNSGRILLQHIYSGVDIMDYVKTDTTTQSFTRVAPLPAVYSVAKNENGLDNDAWDVQMKKEAYYDFDTAEMNINFALDSVWTNTLFLEGEFTLKIELIDGDGNTIQLPSGIEFLLDDKVFSTAQNRDYAVVAAGTPGEHTIQIKNHLYSMKDAVGDKATFRITLYSAPDADYYNHRSAYLDKTTSCSVLDRPVYALKVTPDSQKQILSPGEVLGFAVKTSIKNGADDTVSFKILTKNGKNYETIGWNQVFAGSAISTIPAAEKQYEWKTRDTIKPGTYRVEFSYGDRIEYVNMIIK